MARKQNSSIIAGQFRQRKPERCLHAIDGASGVSGAIPSVPSNLPRYPSSWQDDDAVCPATYRFRFLWGESNSCFRISGNIACQYAAQFDTDYITWDFGAAVMV